MGKLLVIAASMAIAVYLASMAAAGLVLYYGISGGNQYRDDQAVVWHNVICLLESATTANTRASADQKQQAILLYDQLLVLAHANPCPVSTKKG